EVFLLTFNPYLGRPVQYLWSDGTMNTNSSIQIEQSGAYWVTVMDDHQCRMTSHPIQIRISDTPVPQIIGQVEYSLGEEVRLYGYSGKDSNIRYQWYRDGIPRSRESYLIDSSLSAGTYTYSLEISFSDPETGLVCSGTSEPVTVQIYGRSDSVLSSEQFR